MTSLRNQRGFTLLEMAIVLVVAGLLLGGMLGSLDTLQRHRQNTETARYLGEARDALIAFAVINGRLPCPASGAAAATVPGAGLERAPLAVGCSGGQSGVLPWATLGVREADGFGRRVTYRVGAAFSGLPPAFALTTPGDIVVRNGSAVVLADGAPAVLVSHGANARGSFGPAGTVAPGSGNPAEIANHDGDAAFVADAPTETFDDLLEWISRPLLVGRMLEAGRLP